MLCTVSKKGHVYAERISLISIYLIYNDAVCGPACMFRRFQHVKANSVGCQASWRKRKWNYIHLNQWRISRWWARVGSRVVWSSLQRDITVNYIATVYRGNADCCAHRFLLTVQLFTISQGMEKGLVWLLLHTWCRLKHSFLETDDFDVAVNELLMPALPLVWCMCFTLASS